MGRACSSGRRGAVDCHAGPQLTDELFHNIGCSPDGRSRPDDGRLPGDRESGRRARCRCDCFDDAALKCAPWGAYDGLRRLRNTTDSSPIQNRWLRTGAWSDDASATPRAQSYVDLPLTEALKGAWRTPSLRNVALTAPYMHDGRYATLEEVVWHYNTAGHSAGPEQVGSPAPQIKPLMLTDLEMADIVAFLGTLTGTPPPAQWTKAPTP